MPTFVAAMIGAAVAAIAFVLGRRVGTLEGEGTSHAAQKELALAAARLGELSRDLAEAKSEATRAGAEAKELAVRATRAELACAELQSAVRMRDEQLEERAKWLTEATRAMNERFEAVAARIVDERAARVDGKLKEDLTGVLAPLTERLQEFRARLDATHSQSTESQATLREQLRQVVAMNQTLSTDAQRLTVALAGSSQAQGAWGEVVLDRVLQASGLRPDEEYLTQSSHTRDDGSVVRPDVELRLPGGRWVVIDAKVSLVAWQSYVAAGTDVERKVSLTALTQSLRGHLRGLAPRRYASLHGESGVDFVVLFVPIEAAFSTVLGADPELATEAWRGDVLLASPSTLLFVLRAIAHLWRVERQEQNAKAIADRGAELYDKLVGFVADLEQVGALLERARTAHGAATAKFSTGRGNAIRQAELLRELGVKPKKQLPLALVEASNPNGAGPVLTGAPPGGEPGEG